jgi:hypothetical protein
MLLLALHHIVNARVAASCWLLFSRNNFVFSHAKIAQRHQKRTEKKPINAVRAIDAWRF